MKWWRMDDEKNQFNMKQEEQEEQEEEWKIAIQKGRRGIMVIDVVGGWEDAQ